MRILIVGQGLAGSVLAHVLQQRGAEVHLADAGLAGAASAAAAGIINPVTGKRYVKSWNFDLFYPAAQRVYADVEARFGIEVLSVSPIVRLLRGAEEINNWELRCGQADYAHLLAVAPDSGDWAGLVGPDFAAGIIRQAARVRFAPLLGAVRAEAESRGAFFQKKISPEHLAEYATVYDAVVCCEGFWAKNNPFFPDLPWQIAKGEALIVRFADPAAARIATMLKRSTLLAPQGDGTFWVGGSYEWHYADVYPSASEQAYLLAQVAEFVTAPFEVVGHVAGVRPTVRTRRPFLKASPLRPNILIFNGLGTKGALLAPYLAECMAAHLLEGAPLPTWADGAATAT
jgi:glycine oxidase